jgi:SagB-type dehydrogenase family enzyme
LNIILPKPYLTGTISLEECISRRESIRTYTDKEIELEKISQILWAAQGKREHKRTVPSAGATYPLEIYVILKSKGLYHYSLEEHGLEMIMKGNILIELVKASWDQTFIKEAYLNIILCANCSRTTQRYGERGFRYVYIEVGHCAQNIHLQAIALGLASVPIGAFSDHEVKEILILPKNQDPLYIIPIGYPISTNPIKK